MVTEMPIIRKVYKHGNSKAISIPKSWLDLIEREWGKPVREVAMEINDHIMIQAIKPK